MMQWPVYAQVGTGTVLFFVHQHHDQPSKSDITMQVTQRRSAHSRGALTSKCLAGLSTSTYGTGVSGKSGGVPVIHRERSRIHTLARRSTPRHVCRANRPLSI